MPETPRWLKKVGDTEGARHVLSRVYGKNSEAVVEAILRAIDIEILSDEEAPVKTRNSWSVKIRNKLSDLFEVGGHRRALIIACLLQGLQQLCGFVSAFTVRDCHRVLEAYKSLRTLSCTFLQPFSPSSSSPLQHSRPSPSPSQT